MNTTPTLPGAVGEHTFQTRQLLTATYLDELGWPLLETTIAIDPRDGKWFGRWKFEVPVGTVPETVEATLRADPEFQRMVERQDRLKRLKSEVAALIAARLACAAA